MTTWILTGAQILRDGRLQSGDLYIDQGLVSEPIAGATVCDLTGLWLLPGIIDLHGDAIERIIMPRPGVGFDLDLALLEADRQLVSNGITTAFHGLTISWEPGLRSLATARRFVEALEAAPLLCDTRINFRWETFALDAVAEVSTWMARLPKGVLSINDHTTPHLTLNPTHSKIKRMAERTGLSPEDCLIALTRKSEEAAAVPAAIAHMAEAAIKAGLTVLSHDEMTATERRANRALGITAAEFPMSVEAAEAARAGGEHVILGAPNVVRGGSQNNALAAATAMVAGLGTVLATDYYYPAPLAAAFLLHEEHGLPFATAWDFVSKNAAHCAGLTDRGQIATGLRADLIAVCPKTRQVKATFIAGERIYTRA